LDKDPDILKTEPYVYCQNICAPEHPHYGQGRNSWLTGTAAWAYVSATQYILGIRPTFKGLQISPVIPENWNGFSAKRIFRGVTYNISVERIGIGNEISFIEVDGKKIESNIIPFPDKNIKEVNVKVFLGKR
jgi:cellobiose phosphorylase